MILLMEYIRTHGIKIGGKDYEEMVGLKRGDTETEQQLNIVYTKPHSNVVNLYPVYTESY